MANIKARWSWRGYFQGLFGKARMVLVALAVVGVLALAFAGCERLFVDHQHATFVKVPCYVELSTISREVGRDLLMLPAWHYVPTVRFRYENGGESYTSTTISSRVTPLVSKTAADEFQQQFGPGAITTCYIDPDDASNAMLILPHDGNVGIWLRGGGLALGGAILGLLFVASLTRVDTRPPQRQPRAPGWGEIDAGPHDPLNRTRGILREHLER